MTGIPNFSETELWVVRSTLKERYGHDVELEQAEIESRVSPDASATTWCPAVFWSQKGANFVLIKLGAKRYRAIFYYHPEDQVGTGHDDYDEIGDCVVSVLQVESDHIRKQKIERDQQPGATNDQKDDDSSKYSPLFWGD